MFLGGTPMKNFAIPTLILGLLAFASAHAAEAVEETEEQTTGKSLGGMNGMMIGAIGGPLGMLIGAGVGALFGGSAQEAAGLGERDHEAEGADGEQKVLHAPN
ncbi:hypothetical protein AvCA_00560 [Azotobacter vinelandii CA]|uniref:Glycine zipper domain-containing protein n=3 Tax=Azotobacter group TaxID=351 RepID=C1DFZ6_AZOVD|nr:hypothetical protein Avin_00560 [Azotobacter vinelandii DJ]AGK15710.1 hypothetical protein AvCA_00560 [Azotobacter vinelandii CA]AGK19037.1 hypothetical protein AvCA6_00560 [Azotobacter vinelandii CA6]